MISHLIITCHGCTGYSDEIKPLGEYFTHKGWEWKNLVLPGHETTPENLRTKKWKDWTDYVAAVIAKAIYNFDKVLFLAFPWVEL